MPQYKSLYTKDSAHYFVKHKTCHAIIEEILTHRWLLLTKKLEYKVNKTF